MEDERRLKDSEGERQIDREREREREGNGGQLNTVPKSREKKQVPRQPS